jgi:hypothetical protein
LDPVFDLAKYEKQVCFYILSQPRAPHMPIRSRKEADYQNLGDGENTIELFESTI